MISFFYPRNSNLFSTSLVIFHCFPLLAAESARINLELKFSSNTTSDSVKKLEHELNALKRKLTGELLLY